MGLELLREKGILLFPIRQSSDFYDDSALEIWQKPKKDGKLKSIIKRRRI